MTSYARPWTITRSQDATPEIGPQLQRLIPGINTAIAGSKQLATGLVVMPPGGKSKAHLHEIYEIVIFVIEGWAATLLGPDMEPAVQGPGDFLYIPPGVSHLAVNLSEKTRVVGIETRADPNFNDDTVLLPDMDASADLVVAELRKQHAAGLLPEGWQDRDGGPFRYPEN